VLATQTCDIFGDDDHPAHPVAIILPMRTLYDLCTREDVPFKPLEDGHGPADPVCTIHDYIQKHCDNKEAVKRLNDPVTYGPFLRQILVEWKPPRKPPVLRENVGSIKRVINETQDAGYLYWLHPDPTRNIPDAFIDLLCPFSIFTEDLLQVMAFRVASLALLYRAHFADHLGNILSRPATPNQMKPPKAGSPLA
jgi:hypothetical protein